MKIVTQTPKRVKSKLASLFGEIVGICTAPIERFVTKYVEEEYAWMCRDMMSEYYQMSQKDMKLYFQLSRVAMERYRRQVRLFKQGKRKSEPRLWIKEVNNKLYVLSSLPKERELPDGEKVFMATICPLHWNAHMRRLVKNRLRNKAFIRQVLPRDHRKSEVKFVPIKKVLNTRRQLVYDLVYKFNRLARRKEVQVADRQVLSYLFRFNWNRYHLDKLDKEYAQKRRKLLKDMRVNEEALRNARNIRADLEVELNTVIPTALEDYVERVT